MLKLEIILGVLLKAALLLYIIKINVLVSNIYIYVYILSIGKRAYGKPWTRTISLSRKLVPKEL